MGLAALCLLALVLVIAAVLSSLGSNQRRRKPTDGPPRVKAVPFLCTPHERELLKVLQERVIPTHGISLKVRLADVVTPIDSRDRATFNKLSQKHLDFVLFEKGSSAMAAAVELDDSSHNRHDRRQRDQYVEAALKAAGVPLIRGSQAEILARLQKETNLISPAASVKLSA